MAFPTGYLKYQEITIDHTKVAADLTDYVIYINLADLVKAGADIFDSCRTDGGDIRATKTDGSTELAVEVVAIDTTAKTGEIHVKFSGTLSSSTDTVIRIWYNGTDTLPAVTDTYGRNNVWANFGAVYHAQDLTLDSTGDGNTLTNNNSVGTATGKLAGGTGADFGSSNTNKNLSGSGHAGLANNDARSYSLWINVTTPPTTNDSCGILGIGYEDIDVAYIFEYWNHAGTMKLRAGRAKNGVTDPANYVQTLTTGTWFRIDYTTDASRNEVVYVNGTQLGTATAPSGNGSGTTFDGVTFSRQWYATAASARYLSGKVDETRVSAGVKTSTWISTEYNNQNSPSTFYAVGAEVSSGISISPSVQSLTFSLPQETITAGAVLGVNAQSATFSIPAYAASGKALVSVNAQTATFSLPIYTLIANGIALSPNLQNLTFSIPTYQILSGATLDVGAQSLTFSVVAPAITGAALVSPQPVTATFSIPTLAFVGALWRRSARATTGADWTRSSINND